MQLPLVVQLLLELAVLPLELVPLVWELELPELRVVQKVAE